MRLFPPSLFLYLYHSGVCLFIPASGISLCWSSRGSEIQLSKVAGCFWKQAATLFAASEMTSLPAQISTTSLLFCWVQDLLGAVSTTNSLGDSRQMIGLYWASASSNGDYNSTCCMEASCFRIVWSTRPKSRLLVPSSNLLNWHLRSWGLEPVF